LDQLGIGRKDREINAIGIIRAKKPEPNPPPSTAELAIGASISHFSGEAGTLGFFAEDDKGVRGLVSCYHVIAPSNQSKTDDAILCPALDDGGIPSQNTVARVVRVVNLSRGQLQKADCAFARIVDDAQWPDRPGFLGDDGLLSAEHAVIRKGMPVIKIGRTTRRREGRISACWIDRFPMDYNGVDVLFNDVFEIESAEQKKDGETPTFCRPGDSGALVYTQVDGRNYPVGLLFAEIASGGPDSSGRGFATPILKVTRALGVTMKVV
jgi:hypothetical protein